MNAKDIQAIRRARLRRLIEDDFEGVQARFVDATGINQGELSGLLNGKKPFGEKKARGLEALLHLDEGLLDESDGTTRELQQPRGTYAVAVGKRIPVVGGARLGDNGHFVELEYPIGHGDGYIDIPSNDPNAYALRCEGDSMSPRIKHGEFVIVEPGHAVVAGDEVVVKASDGRVMVKTYLYRRDGRVHLDSVNEAHPRVAIDEGQIDALHYVGAIAKASRWVAE